MIEFKEIKTEQELTAVLEMCYRILGNDNTGLYGYEAWLVRLKDGLQPLLYACDNEKIVSADMFGRITRMSFTHLHIPKLVKRFTPREKKQLSEAAPIQKSCLGYAIAKCVAFQRLPSNACLWQLLKI